MQSINVLFRDKTVRRMKRDEAEVLVSAGKASFVSSTIFKAVEAGIPLDSIRRDKDGKALDDDKSIKARIAELTRGRPKKAQPPQESDAQSDEPRLSKQERRARRIAAQAEDA